MQLIYNDTERIETNKDVVNEFREMGQKGVFFLNQRLRYKNFVEREQTEDELGE